jgi:UPF0755 protein
VAAARNCPARPDVTVFSSSNIDAKNAASWFDGLLITRYDLPMKKLLIFVVLLLVVFFGGRHLWYGHSLNPVDASDQARELVKIEKGSSVSTIADMLQEKGIVRSAWAFKKYVKAQGVEADMKAGTVVLNRSMDVPAIVGAITKGEAGELVITIPEGYTVEDIDALLADKGLIKPGDAQKCAQTCDFSSFEFLPKPSELADRGGKLEGYLYPDTYFVTVEDFNVKFFLERLLTTFRHRVVEEYAGDLKSSKRSLHEAVTMASLIEEETRSDDERPTVSGILWKRFEEGMGLGVDAAVRYIVDKKTGALTASDLETDSPYNLRKFRGLPPGPIASPSIKSIEAALRPKESAYYYYLHGTDGRIHYATTNDEHNANKARYL